MAILQSCIKIKKTLFKMMMANRIEVIEYTCVRRFKLQVVLNDVILGGFKNMIKTIMNVRVTFPKDKDSNRVKTVELIVPKIAVNSEMGCTKAYHLELDNTDTRFRLDRDSFELIQNERQERINLYSKDPVFLKCEVEPYCKTFENGYRVHYFKVKLSESITRCFKLARHQETNLKFVKFPFEFNSVQEIDEEAIAMLNLPEVEKKSNTKKEVEI